MVAGALAFLGAGGYAAYERAEQPSSTIFGTAVTHGAAGRRVVALTYDDGPNPPYTSRILDVLERAHVHATFFVVGRAAAAYPGVVEREVRDGDAVGNHSWDHAHLILLSAAAMQRSLQRTDDAVYAAARVHTRLLRPPFGARDWGVMREARRLGYTVVLWSVPLARDWEYPPANVIAARILRYVTDGSIIVLHDGNRGELCAQEHLPAHECDRSSDIQATAQIVSRLKAEGYRFVTVPQLLTNTHGSAGE
jgi:peptidoglycan/xylan/chitin deacetylase (PgdA/CDA1 family)